MVWKGFAAVPSSLSAKRGANSARAGSIKVMAWKDRGAAAGFATGRNLWQSGKKHPGAMPSSLTTRLALCAATAVAVAGGAAFAQGADFTFRRIGVSLPEGPAAGRRITVQIDPEEQARRLAPLEPAVAPIAPGAPVAAPSGQAAVEGARFDWFWTRVPAGLGQGEGRFLAAQAALREAPEGMRVPQPGVQHLQDIAASHGPRILMATVGTRVSPALVLAVIAVESAGRERAVSHAGAQGLMQLIPATAQRFGVVDAMDPGQNIRGGVAYLDWLLGEFGGDVVLALAGYNAGEGAVRRNGGVPPYAETRDYVPRVISAWQVARGLCATLPDLPTDPCVFAIGAVRASG